MNNLDNERKATLTTSSSFKNLRGSSHKRQKMLPLRLINFLDFFSLIFSFHLKCPSPSHLLLLLDRDYYAFMLFFLRRLLLMSSKSLYLRCCYLFTHHRPSLLPPYLLVNSSIIIFIMKIVKWEIRAKL